MFVRVAYQGIEVPSKMSCCELRSGAITSIWKDPVLFKVFFKHSVIHNDLSIAQ